MPMATQTDSAPARKPADVPNWQDCHVVLPRAQHRRLRRICFELDTSMSALLRPLVTAEIERQWVELGLEGVRPPESQAKAK
jgi:hypothetical protein